MLNELNYKEILSRITYKPNVFFSADYHDGRWRLRIVMWAEDSRKPFDPWKIERREVESFFSYDQGVVRPNFLEFVGPQRPLMEVMGNFTIPFFRDDEEEIFIHWFRQMIRGMEFHEMDEWFRLDGELTNDPHKEN